MSIISGFLGDGYYECPDGLANGETQIVYVEAPKGPCGQQLVCYSKDCQMECNFHPRYRDGHFGKIPETLPAKLIKQKCS